MICNLEVIEEVNSLVWLQLALQKRVDIYEIFVRKRLCGNRGPVVPRSKLCS